MRIRSGEPKLRAIMMAMLLAVLAACESGAAASPGADVVRTQQGLVRGILTGNHRVFAGIPFAAPPVGELRWRAPQPPPSWDGIREATRPSDACMQVERSGRLLGSEDCLYLNVQAPIDGSGGRPVMVWLHGGGFVSGTGGAYDASRLVEQGVVVVTLNYRLGALGYLVTGDDPAAGNFGLADQQAALRWVRDNIAAFGGDPGNVTLFGQSAGAFSVCAQLASPAARGLFAKAIIQSGPCANAFLTADQARERAMRWADGLGCADLACLRRKPATELAAIDKDAVSTALGRMRDLPWTPVAGTPLLPKQPLEALREGAAEGIPIIQGTTRDEMRAFVADDFDRRGKPLTAEQYPGAIQRLFGSDAAAVLAEYPVARYRSPGIALSTVLTDWGQKVGSCPALVTDEVASRTTAVYAYEFAHNDGTRVGDLDLGAAHSSELPHIFGPSNPAAPDALSRTLITYWTAFARTGDPGWPRYSGGKVLSIGLDHVGEVNFAADHHCSFWSTHGS